MCRIATQRLDLVAATLEHVQAEIESPERLGVMLGARIGPGWPPGECDRRAQELLRDRLVDGGDGVVGDAGFFGPPNGAGSVEIGCSVVESFQKQGFATEIVQALVAVAFSDPRVRQVAARTTSGNPASITVLERAGFVGAGDDGTLRFELAPSPRPG